MAHLVLAALCRNGRRCEVCSVLGNIICNEILFQLVVVLVGVAVDNHERVERERRVPGRMGNERVDIDRLDLRMLRNPSPTVAMARAVDPKSIGEFFIHDEIWHIAGAQYGRASIAPSL